MVVIGIIAILGLIVTPGIKKIYGDFKIKETYSFIDTIFSVQRSFYLISNERPNENIGPGFDRADPRLEPFLPPGWLINKSKNSVSMGYQGPEVCELKIYGTSLYLINNICVGNLEIGLYYNDTRVNGTIPYYLNDLCDRYIQKNYDVKDYEYNHDVYLQTTITSPEYNGASWFR